MELRLKLTLIFTILILIIIMINFIKKDSVSIKYSLIWLVSGFLMILVILIPNLLEIISKLLGFELVSNMIFMIAIIVLFMICFSFTIIVSKQSQKIKLLIQEVSILKNKLETLETKKGKK